jgi:hypothetical protein
LHILKYLHFIDNENPPDKNSPTYDRFWKLQKQFDILNSRFSEVCRPAEHLSIDEVIVLFEAKVALWQYIPKKHKCFSIKLYKLCDWTGYTFDMTVYLRMQQELATADVSPTHGTMLQDWAINCIWTIISLAQHYLMTSI